MRRLFVLSCLLLSAPLVLGQDMILEEESEVEFPATVDGASGVKLTCLGVSCREKTWLAVNVYAIAQYVDPAGARAALERWNRQTGADVLDDQDFFNALSAADCEKRLRLEFVYDVDAEAIRESFEVSLKTALGELSENANTFVAFFQDAVEEGHNYEIRSLPGGTIEAYQNGELLGTIREDRRFAKAVWEIWLQEELADDYLLTVKNQLVSRLSEVW